MEMRCSRKILHIAYKDIVTNEEVRAKIQYLKSSWRMLHGSGNLIHHVLHLQHLWTSWGASWKLGTALEAEYRGFFFLSKILTVSETASYSHVKRNTGGDNSLRVLRPEPACRVLTMSPKKKRTLCSERLISYKSHIRAKRCNYRTRRNSLTQCVCHTARYVGRDREKPRT